MMSATSDDAPVWLGRDAAAVASEIVHAHPEIAQIRVFKPRQAPEVQSRLVPSRVEMAAVSKALRLRDQLGLPFWEAILLSIDQPGQSALSLIPAALYHNPANEEIRWVDSSDVSEEGLRALCEEIPPGRMLAVSSAVHLIDGSQRHIPMIDFRLATSRDHITLATNIVRSLGMRGFLLDSGRSFHFYGEGLLSEDELIGLLARSLLLGPLVDHRWIAHQLIERACALRISPDERGMTPRVVARL